MTPDHERLLSAAPFHLDGPAIAWVDQQLSTLSLDQKIHQLFVLMMIESSDASVEQIREFQPGGVVRSCVTNSASTAWSSPTRPAWPA